jgi:diguanylate cyclase (GGDEF)-like protein
LLFFLQWLLGVNKGLLKPCNHMFNIDKNILKQALDVSPVATVIVDLQGSIKSIVYVNQAFEAVSGFDASELIGHPWADLLDEAKAKVTDFEELVAVRCHERLGAADHLPLDMLPLFDRPGAPRYWVGTERSIAAPDAAGGEDERETLLSVMREARMHLRRLDGRDSATGILNRRAFDDLLQRDWVLARREQRALGIMLFQLDGFDAYRDVYGRHAADSCLAKVAHAITGSLRRASDLAARFADDQFVVLLGPDDEDKIAELAGGIAAKVRGLAIHHPRSPVDRFVTISCGVASLIPHNNGGCAQLLKNAEQGLEANLPQERGLSMI